MAASRFKKLAVALTAVTMSAGVARAEYRQMHWGFNPSDFPADFAALSVDGTQWLKINALLNPYLPGLSSSVDGSGVPGLDRPANGWLVLVRPSSSAANPQAALRVQRNNSYSGGSGVEYTLWTSCTTSALQTTFSYCGLDTLDNYATSTLTNAVARYSQAFKQAGAAATFASVSELRDYNTDPATGAVTQEIDLWGYDTDANGNRVGIDLVAGPIPGVSGHNPTISRMLRIGAQNGDPSLATIDRGLAFTQATWGTLIGYEGAPAAIHGIDLSGVTFSGCAICLTGNQKLSMDGAAATRYLTQGAGTLVWATPSGSSALSVGDEGELWLGVGTSAIAADYPVLNATQTWNNGAVAFTAAKINVTDTASDAASMLQRWQVGGSDVASIDKTGRITADSAILNSFVMTGALFGGVLPSSTLVLQSTLGAGASDSIVFKTGAAVTRWGIDTNGHFLAATDNAYDIGASAASRPRNVYAATGFSAAGSAGQTATITVRDAAGTGTCTLIFTGGLKTGGTC